MDVSLDHSEGSLLSEDALDTEDDALDTGDDLDVSIDELDTPDEADLHGHTHTPEDTHMPKYDHKKDILTLYTIYYQKKCSKCINDKKLIFMSTKQKQETQKSLIWVQE